MILRSEKFMMKCSCQICHCSAEHNGRVTDRYVGLRGWNYFAFQIYQGFLRGHVAPFFAILYLAVYPPSTGIFAPVI